MKYTQGRIVAVMYPSTANVGNIVRLKFPSKCRAVIVEAKMNKIEGISAETVEAAAWQGFVEENGGFNKTITGYVDIWHSKKKVRQDALLAAITALLASGEVVLRKDYYKEGCIGCDPFYNEGPDHEEHHFDACDCCQRAQRMEEKYDLLRNDGVTLSRTQFDNLLRMAGCDCDNPEPDSGVALVSNGCIIHGDGSNVECWVNPIDRRIATYTNKIQNENPPEWQAGELRFAIEALQGVKIDIEALARFTIKPSEGM